MNIALLRLHNQGLLEDHFKKPEQVVQWFGAVQAQEYQASLWAIGLRLPATTTEETIKQAITDRKILRTWPMRGTIHYVPAEDAAWMTQLMARRVNVRFQSYFKKIDLTPDILVKGKAILMQSLAGGKQLTRKEIYEAFVLGGVESKQHGLHIIGHCAQEGLVCFGPYRDKQPTFVALDDWVLHPRKLEGDAALAEIVRKYFTSHGPATVYDCSWWSGLTTAEVKRGLDIITGELISEIQNGKEYWFAPYKKEPSITQSALLLPCFDEYTVAYKDRSVVVSDTLLKQVGYGISNNVIIDGRIMGTWRRIIAKNTIALEVQPLTELTTPHKKEILAAAEKFGKFMNRTIRVTFLHASNN